MDRTKFVQFTEPVPIITTHSHRLAFFDVLGGDFHFALCIEQPMTGMKRGLEFVINNRISMPISGVVNALPRVITRLPEAAAHNLIERLICTWRGDSGLLS